jgi:hypothetical protein
MLPTLSKAEPAQFLLDQSFVFPARASRSARIACMELVGQAMNDRLLVQNKA